MWVLGWVLLWLRAVRTLFWSEWGWGYGLKEASKSSSLGQALGYDMMLGRYKKELNTVELEDRERDLRVSGLSLHNNSYWFPVQNGTLLTGQVTFLDVNPTVHCHTCVRLTEAAECELVIGELLPPLFHQLRAVVGVGHPLFSRVFGCSSGLWQCQPTKYLLCCYPQLYSFHLLNAHLSLGKSWASVLCHVRDVL